MVAQLVRWSAFVAVLASLLFAIRSCLSQEPGDAAQGAKDRTVVETLLRLKGVSLQGNPQWKAAVLRHLDRIQGEPKYFELIERFKIQDRNEQLVELAAKDPASTAGVNSARLLVAFQDRPRVDAAIAGEDEERAANLVAAIGLVGTAEAVEWILPLATDNERGVGVRAAAVTAIGRSVRGQRQLLDWVREGKLAKEFHFAAANSLHASPDEQIRAAAGRLLPLPATKNASPLPPIAELSKRKGDGQAGQKVFQVGGTCLKCHKVRGEGKEVGPDLTEIGGKLSREAFYVAILDPSAGISHNYESYSVTTSKGQILTGLKISETDDSVTIRSAEGVDRKLGKEEVEEITRQKISLMPADLQKNMTEEDLVNLVEYLTTLKKPPKTP